MTGKRARLGVMMAFLTHGLIVSTWISRIASVKSNLRLSDGAFGLALLGTAIGSSTAIHLCGSIARVTEADEPPDGQR